MYESKKKDAQLKVIDFGTAKSFKPNQKMNETYGTVSLSTLYLSHLIYHPSLFLSLAYY